MDFYESGSFRTFYKADTPNVTIKTSVTSMVLTNTAKSVKSATGKYPTSPLTYAYSTNLKTGTDISISAMLKGVGILGFFLVGLSLFIMSILRDTKTNSSLR